MVGQASGGITPPSQSVRQCHPLRGLGRLARSSWSVDAGELGLRQIQVDTFGPLVFVNPDLDGMARQPALTPAATKAAMAAGVKTAALVNYEKYATRTIPPIQAKKDAKPKAKAAPRGA